MLSQLINRPCQVRRRLSDGVTDELGNEIPGETSVDTVWEVQRKREEPREHDDAVARTDWVAFFLADEGIDSGDAVVDGPTGQVFEVVGDPWPVRNPRTKTPSHVEADVRRTAGSEDSS